MQLFKKHNETEQTPQIETSSEAIPSASGTNEENMAEQIARQWWMRHLGCSIPRDIEDWIQQLTRTEARKLTLQSAMLNAKQIERTTEALRLGQTHLQHIEEQIHRVTRQQEWLHNFRLLNQARDIHANALYEANKRLAIDINDEKRLERFETFEPIQGSFQHLRLLTTIAQQQQEELSDMQTTIQKAKTALEEESKMAEEQHNQFAEAEKRMEQANIQTEQLYRILGERTVLDITLREATLRTEQLTQQHQVLMRSSNELEAQVEQQEIQLGTLRTQLQALEGHCNMLEHAQENVLRLKMMEHCRTEIEALTQQREEANRKLREENKTMGILFEDYQRIEGEINELNDELQQHRHSIAGATSYQLQERAMREKTHHQILLSAQVNWQHICNGYQKIEQLREELTRIEHQIRYGAQNIATLEKDVTSLGAATRDKEYTLTMSKSQSVIQLRSDLKEGISCTVCGAAHHPYHSDTMLEQNVLIDNIRSEYNQLNQEYQGKLRRLEEQRKEHTVALAAREQKQAFLDYVLQRQEALTAQWKMYADFDPSFADCSPGTNQSARTEMIRLLIENTLRQSRDAQEKLDTHNFHQAEINKLTEQMAAKEQEKGHLLTRLNEVNTGCHVLSRQVELLENGHQEAQKRYSHHYEEVAKNISLHEWMKQWETDNEQLCQHITGMAQQLTSVQADIQTLEAERDHNLAMLQYLSDAMKFLDSCIQGTQVEMEKLSVMRQEGQKNYDQLMEQQHEENFHKVRYQELKNIHQLLSAALAEREKSVVEVARAEGKQQELTRSIKNIEQQMARLRYSLDLWISRYNANHPPVQYEELESTLDAATDWGAIRQNIRRTRVEAASQDLMVKFLESEITNMQDIASKRSTNIHELTEHSLAEELKQLGEEHIREALFTAKQQLALERDSQIRQTLQQEDALLQKLGQQ